jgi:hypothetical protein
MKKNFDIVEKIETNTHICYLTDKNKNITLSYQDLLVKNKFIPNNNQKGQKKPNLFIIYLVVILITKCFE